MHFKTLAILLVVLVTAGTPARAASGETAPADSEQKKTSFLLRDEADAYFKAGDYARAQRLHEQAKAIDERKWQPNLENIRIHNEAFAKPPFKQAPIDENEVRARLQPHFPNLQLAECYRLQHELTLAEHEYEQLLTSENPTGFIRAYLDYRLSQVYSAEGRAPQAKQAYSDFTSEMSQNKTVLDVHLPLMSSMAEDLLKDQHLDAADQVSKGLIIASASMLQVPQASREQTKQLLLQLSSAFSIRARVLAARGAKPEARALELEAAKIRSADPDKDAQLYAKAYGKPFPPRPAGPRLVMPPISEALRRQGPAYKTCTTEIERQIGTLVDNVNSIADADLCVEVYRDGSVKPLSGKTRWSSDEAAKKITAILDKVKVTPFPSTIVAPSIIVHLSGSRIVRFAHAQSH